MAVKLRLKAEYNSPKAAIRALRREIERLELLAFDPSKVSGSLLIRFAAEAWPEGWVWEDDPGWAEPGEDPCEAGGAEPLDADGIYDIRDQWLCPDDDRKDRRLADFVREWVKGLK